MSDNWRKDFVSTEVFTLSSLERKNNKFQICGPINDKVRVNESYKIQKLKKCFSEGT